jgi:hypothetical protein
MGGADEEGSRAVEAIRTGTLQKSFKKLSSGRERRRRRERTGEVGNEVEKRRGRLRSKPAAAGAVEVWRRPAMTNS